MNEWKQYRKTATQEMRPYVPGEDLSGISVSAEDTPEIGGMIARNAKNHNDQWYVAKRFFLDSYELASDESHCPYCVELRAAVERMYQRWKWLPVTETPEVGPVWVVWVNEDGNENACLAHYEPADGFCFMQPAYEYQRHDNYTFDYIGRVTHWKPVVIPLTPAEESTEEKGGES